jgi:hypothetical protein
MLSVLAFRVGKMNSTNLGFMVLFLNIGSATIAIMSSGFLLVLSVVLWAHAFWLFVKEVAFIANTQNNSLVPTPGATHHVS